MRGADNGCHWISWSEVTVSELHVDLSRPQSSPVAPAVCTGRLFPMPAATCICPSLKCPDLAS